MYTMKQVCEEAHMTYQTLKYYWFLCFLMYVMIHTWFPFFYFIMNCDTKQLSHKLQNLGVPVCSDSLPISCHRGWKAAAD